MTNEKTAVKEVVITAPKLAVNTEIKPTSRAIGVALFNSINPMRESEEISSLAFRTFILDRISSECNTSSAPTVYNHAKTKYVENGGKDFARSVGEKIGSKKDKEVDDKTEAKIHKLFDKAVEEATKEAQQADLATRQEKADAEAQKAHAKAEKEKKRKETLEKREADAKAEKEAKAKKREEARATKLKEKEDAKKAKEDLKAKNKANAEKEAKENPEMKWKVVDSDGKTVALAQGRKEAFEKKKAHKDAENLRAVKITETA